LATAVDYGNNNMNILDSVLHGFHFSSTMYCAYCTNRAPWGMGLAQSRSAQFHAVRSGQCWVRVGDHQFPLETGDFVVLPHGDEHEVVDSRKTKAVPAREVLAGIPRSNPWVVNLGEKGQLAILICAGFLYSAHAENPILQFLPKMIHLRASETASLEPLLILAEQEMQNPNAGTNAMLARIAEMLMVECIRTYVQTLDPGQGGWLAALQDHKLSAVMQAIHEKPARPWTLAELAAKVGISRTSLAARFRAVVGMTVRQYITRLRLTLAASMLETPNRPSVAEIAQHVGYSSEAAFSRAFSREMGVAPSRLLEAPK
jgi:AraC-like DNA-binding protein